jgi:hypothetical protein
MSHSGPFLIRSVELKKRIAGQEFACKILLV